MAEITNEDWQEFRNIVDESAKYINNDTITWLRHNSPLNRFGDTPEKDGFTEITLNCLVQYNAFRTWPTQLESQAGLVDNESMAIYLNITYLRELGYANQNGYLLADPGKDYFIHRGQKYRPAGEILASQANSEPIHNIIILKRVVIDSGNNKY